MTLRPNARTLQMGCMAPGMKPEEVKHMRVIFFKTTTFGRSVVQRSFGGWRSAADSKHDLGKTLVIIVVIPLPSKLVRKAKPELSMNTNQIKNKTKMK